MLEDLLGFTSTFLNNALAVILQALPDSPFQEISKSTEIIKVLGYLNYFVPIREMVIIFNYWIAAVTTFYIFQMILRWARAIE